MLTRRRGWRAWWRTCAGCAWRPRSVGRWGLSGGSSIASQVEVAARFDGGDAETGAGAEAGAGLGYVHEGIGLSVDARGRALVAHQASSFREWGRKRRGASAAEWRGGRVVVHSRAELGQCGERRGDALAGGIGSGRARRAAGRFPVAGAGGGRAACERARERQPAPQRRPAPHGGGLRDRAGGRRASGAVRALGGRGRFGASAERGGPAVGAGSGDARPLSARRCRAAPSPQTAD